MPPPVRHLEMILSLLLMISDHSRSYKLAFWRWTGTAGSQRSGASLLSLFRDWRYSTRMPPGPLTSWIRFSIAGTVNLVGMRPEISTDLLTQRQEYATGEVPRPLSWIAFTSNQRSFSRSSSVRISVVAGHSRRTVSIPALGQTTLQFPILATAASPAVASASTDVSKIAV